MTHLYPPGQSPWDARVTLSVFAFIILLPLLARMLSRGSDGSRKWRYLVALVVGNMVLLVTSAVRVSLEGQPGELTRGILVAALGINFAWEPAEAFLGLFYLLEWFGDRRAELAGMAFWKRGVPALAAASLALNGVLCLSGCYWVFDASNQYTRGPGFWVSTALSIVPLLVALGLTLVVRGERTARLRLNAYFLLLPPLFAGILHVMFFRWTIVWPTVSYAILVIYLDLEADQAGRDFLTRLHNRTAFERELQRRCRSQKAGRQLAVLQIDVDRFKAINDRFGHAEGDKALRQAAEFIRGALRAEDFVARTGGDEFVALCWVESESALRGLAGQVADAVRDGNRRLGQPWALSVSVGVALRTPEESPSSLVSRADEAMYGHKSSRTFRARPPRRTQGNKQPNAGRRLGLAEQILQVSLDSAVRNEQPVGDVLVRQALEKKQADLAFPG